MNNDERNLIKNIAIRFSKKVLDQIEGLDKVGINEVNKSSEIYEVELLGKYLNKKVSEYFHKDIINIPFIPMDYEYGSHTVELEHGKGITYGEMSFNYLMNFYLACFYAVIHDEDELRNQAYSILLNVFQNGMTKYKTISRDEYNQLVVTLSADNVNAITHLSIVSYVFVLLHELCHIYFGHSKEQQSLEIELETDKQAYYILKQLINEYIQSPDQYIDCFEPYTIVAPILYFECLETNNNMVALLEGKGHLDINAIVRRKEQLFNILESFDEEYNQSQEVYQLVTYAIDTLLSMVDYEEMILELMKAHQEFIEFEEIKEFESDHDFIVFKDEKGYYISPKNFKLNLKAILEWAGEFVLTQTFKGVTGTVRIILLTVLKILQFARVELDEDTSQVILCLHKMNCYDTTIDFLEENDQGISTYDFNQVIHDELVKVGYGDISLQSIERIKKDLIQKRILRNHFGQLYLGQYIYPPKKK